MTTREILTIQCGHFSNFIGTHWWNLQETNFSYDPDNPSEINHDVLYRSGETSKREVTYTPRLLIVDLKESLGYLSPEGTLYNTYKAEDEHSHLWDDDSIDVTRKPTNPKPPFISSLDKPAATTESESVNLESDVHTWTDFLLPRFHPRTVNIVRNYKHECTVQPFDIFTYGQNVWHTEQFSDDFADRIRIYSEECDLMQGFQVLLDSTDGFAGFGASCVQHLQDEYGKSVLAFPTVNSTNTEPSASDLTKLINIALCWQRLGESSSLFSPLCCGEKGWPQAGDPRKFKHLSYNMQMKYHSSAILATALDTLTLRYRRKEYPNVSVSDLCADLNMHGRKAAATSLSLPFPMTIKKDLIDILDEFEGNLWTSLTPSCDVQLDKTMQSVVLRGVTEDRLKRPIQDARKQMSKAAYKCSSVHEMMTLYLACTCHASATYLSTINSALKIRDPFPKIFNKDISETGDVAGWPLGTNVESVPVMAGLHSGSNLSAMYESLHTQLRRVKDIKRHHAFLDTGLEQDEFTECLNHLLDCKEAYEDHYV